MTMYARLVIKPAWLNMYKPNVHIFKNSQLECSYVRGLTLQYISSDHKFLSIACDLHNGLLEPITNKPWQEQYRLLEHTNIHTGNLVWVKCRQTTHRLFNLKCLWLCCAIKATDALINPSSLLALPPHGEPRVLGWHASIPLCALRTCVYGVWPCNPAVSPSVPAGQERMLQAHGHLWIKLAWRDGL